MFKHLQHLPDCNKNHDSVMFKSRCDCGLGKTKVVLAELIKIVRRLEWFNDSELLSGQCPECCGFVEEGHAEHCDLMKVLKTIRRI